MCLLLARFRGFSTRAIASWSYSRNLILLYTSGATNATMFSVNMISFTPLPNDKYTASVVDVATVPSVPL